MDRYGPGWAEGWPASQPHRKTHRTEQCLLDDPPLCNRDGWIESYVRYLLGEHLRLRGGPIAAHYLRCLLGAYREFRISGFQHDRFRTWVAVKTTCQWLAQLAKLRVSSGPESVNHFGQTGPRGQQRIANQAGCLMLKATLEVYTGAALLTDLTPSKIKLFWNRNGGLQGETSCARVELRPALVDGQEVWWLKLIAKRGGI